MCVPAAKGDGRGPNRQKGNGGDMECSAVQLSLKTANKAIMHVGLKKRVVKKGYSSSNQARHYVVIIGHVYAIFYFTMVSWNANACSPTKFEPLHLITILVFLVSLLDILVTTFFSSSFD
jgi:hypothetical protein